MATIATFYDHILDIAKQEGISEEEALWEAKALGIGQLEVSLENARGRGKELGARLARAGLGISSAPSFFDFGREDGDAGAQVRAALDLARELGADRLLVIPGFTQGSPAQAQAQTQRMLAGAALLGELADKAGVSLVMEDFDNAAAPYSTSAGMLRFMEACPGLRACFDTGNFRYMAEDTLSAYRALRGRIAHVHLKDRAYSPAYGVQGPTAVDGQPLYPCPVGWGEMPIGQVMACLREDGYDGAYTIEHYGADHMLACLKQSAAWVAQRL